MKREYHVCWAPTNAQLIFAWINSLKFHYFWNYKIYSCLLKNWENQENYFKIKKKKCLLRGKKCGNLIKIGILLTLRSVRKNKKKKKDKELKLFENQISENHFLKACKSN